MASRLPQHTRQPARPQQGSKSQPHHQSRPVNQTAQPSATASVQKRGTLTYASIVSRPAPGVQGPPNQSRGHSPDSPIRPAPASGMTASYTLVLDKFKIVASVLPNDVYQTTNKHHIRKLGEKVHQLLPSIPSDLVNETKYKVQPEPAKQPDESSTFADIMPLETSSIDVMCHPKEENKKRLDDLFSVDLRQEFNDVKRRFQDMEQRHGKRIQDLEQRHGKQIQDLEQRHGKQIQDLEQEVGNMRPKLIALSVRQCLVSAQTRLVKHYEHQKKLAGDFESQKNWVKAEMIYKLVECDEDLEPKFSKREVKMMFGVEERDFRKTLLNRGNNVAHPAPESFNYVSYGLEGAEKKALRRFYDYAYGQE